MAGRALKLAPIIEGIEQTKQWKQPGLPPPKMSKIVSMIRKYHNLETANNPVAKRDGSSQVYHHVTPGRQIKQSNQRLFHQAKKVTASVVWLDDGILMVNSLQKDKQSITHIMHHFLGRQEYINP